MILLFDSDSSVRTMMHDVLEDQGYLVVSADALSLCFVRRHMPQLILMELVYPCSGAVLGLIQAMRSDPAIRAIPIMVSLTRPAPVLRMTTWASKAPGTLPRRALWFRKRGEDG